MVGIHIGEVFVVSSTSKDEESLGIRFQHHGVTCWDETVRRIVTGSEGSGENSPNRGGMWGCIESASGGLRNCE